MKKTLCLVFLMFFSQLAFGSDGNGPAGYDWPNWRGPSYDGSSAEKGLLREWPKEGPRIVWKSPILRGWNCPVVSGDEIFVFGTEEHHGADYKAGAADGPDGGTREGDNKETLQCLDAKTGKEKWRYAYPSKYGFALYCTFGPRSTPTVTADKVFMMDQVGLFTCVNRKTGEKLWSRDLAAEFKRDLDGQRGWNNCPIVSGDVVILNMPCGNKPRDPFPTPKCLAMDQETGKTVWLFDEPHRPGNGPCNVGGDPIVANFNGEACVVFSVNRTIRALRCSDGKEIWRSDHQRKDANGSNTPNLLPVGNAFLQLNSGLDDDYLVEVDRQNPALPTKVLWKSSDIRPRPGCWQTSNFVYSNGCFFGFTNKQGAGINGGGGVWALMGDSVLHCIDSKTGKRLWTSPPQVPDEDGKPVSSEKSQFWTGSCLITADNLLFARTFNTLLLLEASPEGYVEKGRVHPLQTFTADPPKDIGDAGRDNGFVEPVLSRGYLYVRGPTELICFDVADRK